MFPHLQRPLMSESTRGILRRLLPVVMAAAVTACSGEAGRSPSGHAASPGSGVVELSPQPAYAGSVLTAIVRQREPAESASARYAYQWRRNGKLIDGVAGATLPDGVLRKGDVVTVTATAIGGPQQGAPITSPSITIQNSPPVVKAVGMAPSPLYHHVAVHAVVQDSDPDGDPIRYAYQWFKNDAIIPGQTAEELDGDLIAKDDVIHVMVTPSDGETTGDPLRAVPLKVLNSPPRITSQPTATLNKDDSYVYQVAAEDGDGDPIIYSLTSAPQGMTIDPERGLIHWKVSVKDQGIHPIEITVANADGAKTMQRYDLRIDDLTGQSTPPPPQASR
jgi:hypothetical protein